MAAHQEHTGLLGYLADAVLARAASYRDKAAVLRKMAEAEPVVSLRDGLLDLSRRFDGMANNIGPGPSGSAERLPSARPEISTADPLDYLPAKQGNLGGQPS